MAFDAQVGGFAGALDEVQHLRMAEPDEGLVAEGLRPKLHDAASGAVATVGVFAHKAGGLQGAQQPERGAWGEFGEAGALREGRTTAVAHHGEQSEGTLHGSSR
jgi:hypothetical protein